MSTFKKTKVVMLPTNEKASLKLGQNRLLVNNTFGYDSHFTNQHLYILSDEEIKEGDWFVGFADGSIKPFVMQADESTIEINNWQLNKKGYSSNKKIIATTDESFYGGELCLFPKPSQSFIEKFVEEYNKENVITEVMVEYEPIGAYSNPKYDSDYRLKINPKDNTITIRKVKDSWNRGEVEEKIRQGVYVILNGSFEDFDKWIEENL